MKIGIEFIEHKPKWQPDPLFWMLFAITMLVMFSLILSQVRAEEVDLDKEQAIKAIIGEASNQGYYGMLTIAVAIRNRETLKGVYGLKAKHIEKEPKWVWNLAKKAWKESKYNRFHSGTHWENIKVFGKPYWVKTMILVYQYKDHNFYKEKNGK
jgi:hypothetical protein